MDTKKAAYAFGQKPHDWKVFEIGAMKIVVDNDGFVNFLSTPHEMLSGAAARSYIAGHPDVNTAFSAWCEAREQAIGEWIANSTHFRFYSDGGTLAVRIDGGAVLRVCCDGDGANRVIVSDSDLPGFFTFTDLIVENCTIEPLDYDCGGGKPLCKERVKSALFYRRHGGDVGIAIERA